MTMSLSHHQRQQIAFAYFFDVKGTPFQKVMQIARQFLVSPADIRQIVGLSVPDMSTVSTDPTPGELAYEDSLRRSP
jgi:hypothetical protein